MKHWTLEEDVKMIKAIEPFKGYSEIPVNIAKQLAGETDRTLAAVQTRIIFVRDALGHFGRTKRRRSPFKVAPEILRKRVLDITGATDSLSTKPINPVPQAAKSEICDIESRIKVTLDSLKQDFDYLIRRNKEMKGYLNKLTDVRKAIEAFQNKL